MKSGNINYINDVLKTLHDSGYKLDQVIGLVVFQFEYCYLNDIWFMIFFSLT